MSRSLNKSQFLGNLGSIEARQTSGGTTVVNATLAANRTYLDRQHRKVEETTWIRLVLWDKVAEVAEKYLRTGSRVFVEGRLEETRWTPDGVTDSDGKPFEVRSYQLVVQELIMLDSAPAETRTGYNGHDASDHQDGAR